MKIAAQKALVVTLLALPLAAASSVPTAKPEDVGVSSERLQRISQMIQRRIAAGEMTGAVTIVARKGKIVHLEAQGVMDLDSKKPVAKDTMFRVASMTKPVTGLAIMMMIEEGKVRLNDPVSRYIPEFKNLKVAIAQPAPADEALQRLRRLLPVDAEPRRISTPFPRIAKSRSRIC